MTIGDENQKKTESEVSATDSPVSATDSPVPAADSASPAPPASWQAQPTGWQPPQPTGWQVPPTWQPPQSGWQTPPAWQQPGQFWPPVAPPPSAQAAPVDPSDDLLNPGASTPGATPPATSPSTPPGPPTYYTPAWQSEASPNHRPSKLPQILMILAVALLSFAAGMVTDSLVFGNGTGPAAQPSASSVSGSDPLPGFGLYKEALSLVRDNYVGRSDVTDSQLLYGSIRGMVDSLGDTGHTVFMTPEEYGSTTSSLNGSFGGIGVVGTESNGIPSIERVLPGTPAQKAGLLAGDQILAVDGVSTSGKTFADIVPSVRGKVGTTVTLTVVHSGSTTPVDITVTRAEIKVPLVEWGMVPGAHIADIVLFEFSSGATAQLETAISEAKAQGATAIILDLRGNPGGYVAEAQGVAGNFMTDGVLYIQQDAKGTRTSVKIDTRPDETKLPMVVLVDHSTASAAEIVAGALQDSGRAKVVGITTVGTGTVLQVYPLSDGSAIALATAEWLTPNGDRIFGKGITPDELVALPPGVAPTDPATLDTTTATQFAASKDAELLAAVKDLGQ